MLSTEEAKLINHLKNKKEQVEHILKNYPSARDNDFYLQLIWLKLFGGLSTKLPFLKWPEIEAVSGQLESVRRVRQKIQNEDGHYLPSPTVLAKRRIKRANFRIAIKQV